MKTNEYDVKLVVIGPKNKPTEDQLDESRKPLLATLDRVQKTAVLDAYRILRFNYAMSTDLTVSEALLNLIYFCDIHSVDFSACVGEALTMFKTEEKWRKETTL